MLVPEGFVAHHGVGLSALAALEFELAVGDFGETEVGVLCGTADLELLEEVDDFQLYGHVVGNEDLLAGGKGGERLGDGHALDPVDIGTIGNAHLSALDAVGGVGDDEEVAREAEVLRIVGREADADALLGVDVEGVLDEVAVEGNGGAGRDGADEGVLKEAYVVLVDVDVGETVLEHGGHNVARVEEFVDAVGLLAEDDFLFSLGVFAVDLAGDRLVDGDGENPFPGGRVALDMFLEERHPLETALLEDLLRHFVEGEGEFLVFVVAVVFVLREVAPFLGGDDFTHEFDGGVVLAAVFLLTATHDGLAHLLGVVFKFNVYDGGVADGDALGFVSYVGDAQRGGPAGNGVASGGVGLYAHTSFIMYVGKWDGTPGA